MALDDAQADGEPQPCPLALALGREERIEDLRQDVGGDTAARICDLDHARSLILARSHRHDAISSDGLYRVQDQIHQHLLNHVAVGQKQRKLAAELLAQTNAAAFESIVRERQHALDQRVHFRRSK